MLLQSYVHVYVRIVCMYLVVVVTVALPILYMYVCCLGLAVNSALCIASTL